MNDSKTIIAMSNIDSQQQSTTSNGIEDLSTIMHPLLSMSVPVSMPSSIPSIFSMSSLLSSQNVGTSSKGDYTKFLADEISAPKTNTINEQNKRLSFSSTTSVTDSGTESIIDEEYANEKILDYFAQDNSKTVQLARRKMSSNIYHSTPFKANKYANDHEQYDSDDSESTLFNESFLLSPADEYDGTPRSDDVIFNFDIVCAAIDEKLKKEQTKNYKDSVDYRNHKNVHHKSHSEQKSSNNDCADISLEELCDNGERRNSVLVRSTSLKSGKTPPGTPGGGKKIVRFADAMGLDLASIRHIVYDDAPYIPPLAAFKALQLDDEDRDWLFQNHSSNQFNIPNMNDPNVNNMKTTLRMLFGQPSSDPLHFMERVRSNKVCLENCLLTGPSGSNHVFNISCIVRVLNICFHKKVYLRYTTNEWLTWDEVQGTYVNNSNDGFSDKFVINFELSLNPNGCQTMLLGQRLLFAIRYLTNDSDEHWDNNIGMNYVLIYQRC